MRFVIKLAVKFLLMVAMVLVMGSVMKRGSNFLTGGAARVGAADAPKFSSEEADLMSTVFKSAIKLFTGQAKRDELASELSDKLYAGRADPATMAELGIELVKPGASQAPPEAGVSAPPGAKLPDVLPGAGAPGAKQGERLAKVKAGGSPNAKAGAALPSAQADASATAKRLAHAAGASAKEQLSGAVRTDLLGRIWEQSKPYKMEMSLVPVVLLGMVLVGKIRRRREPDFVPSMIGIMPPAESEPFDLKHDVHSLGSEEFELLVALIYQRQGYRISMPAGLSGGRGGDYTLLRKSEKILVQCKKLSLEHRVAVDRVRELHEAMTATGATRGMYVVSCGYTWDARNFAKAKGITLINARTLDELIAAAKENPDEDLLDVSQWMPKLMTKVQMTPPHCPACEASMDQISVSTGAVWVCSQRPDCRGRRSARKYQKPDPAAARNVEQPTEEPAARSTAQPEPRSSARPAGQPVNQPTARPAPQPEARPAAQSAARPAAQSTARPASQPTGRPANQSEARPAVQPQGRPGSQSAAKPAVQPAARPANQSAAKPAVQPVARPENQSAGKPAVQPAARPANQSAAKPAVQPAARPANQSAAKPAVHPAARPENQSAGKPAVQPAARPANQSAAKPAVQPAARPADQPPPKSGAEPVIQPAAKSAAQFTAYPSDKPAKPPVRSTYGATRYTGQPAANPAGNVRV